MRKRRRHYGRTASIDFGEDLRNWRHESNLTLEKAARRLGLRGEKPGAYLSMIERGLRPIPHVVLQNVSHVYKKRPEEVIMRSYLPQLTFDFLDAMNLSEAVSKKVDEYLSEVEQKLDEDKKRELSQFAAFLFITSTTPVKR
ncbi:MAG: helix-turn-helix transcriptional regulator [Dehalococcoidia bacterium]